MEVCEFCGKKVKAIKSTSMTGEYCIDCLQLTIAECRSAIKALKEQGIKPKGQRARKEEYQEALNNLTIGPGDT